MSKKETQTSTHIAIPTKLQSDEGEPTVHKEEMLSTSIQQQTSQFSPVLSSGNARVTWKARTLGLKKYRVLISNVLG